MSWKKVTFFIAFILVVAVSALGGGLVGGIAVFSAMQARNPQAAITNVPSLPQPVEANHQSLQVSSTDIETAITSAVEKVGPTVVTVRSIIPGQISFFGQTPDQEVSGSGVIISSEGYILTNNHVIEGSTQVSVILADGSELPVKVISTDLFADLAVLKTEGNMPAVATLGNSDTLKPGQKLSLDVTLGETVTQP